MELSNLAVSVLDGLDHAADCVRSRSSGFGYASVTDQRDAGIEPIVAYVRAEENGEPRNFYIARHGAFLSLTYGDCWFVTYKSPVGKIASHEPGDLVRVPMPGGRPDRLLRIIGTDFFIPDRRTSDWDARRNQTRLPSGNFTIPSFRTLLEQSGGESITRGFEKPDLVKVALRDQFILDKHQDSIFRLPAGSSFIVTGSAGTGKTTVLVKRIALKRELVFKTREEEDIDPRILTAAYNLPVERRWILFTPTSDLLAYLKEALSKEQVPAPDSMVKTWESFSLNLARDLGLLAPRRLSLLPQGKPVLLAAASRDLAAFTDDLRHRFLERLLAFPSRMGEWLRETERFGAPERRPIVDRFISLMRANSTQRPRIDTTSVYEVAKSLILFYQNALMPDPRNSPALRDFAELVPVARELWRSRGITTLEGIKNHLAESYPSLRQAMAREGVVELEPPEDSSAISLHELDAILCLILEVGQAHHRDGLPFARGVDQLHRVYEDSIRTSVYVDEAPDFSAVQLRCMRLISHPALPNVCAVGDLLQKLSPHGIEDWNDCAWSFGEFGRHELRTVYRHSSILFELARSLYGAREETRNGYERSTENRRPFVRKYGSESELGAWLADSIAQAAGRFEHMPSMAIFVEREADIDRIHELVHDELFRFGIEAEKCPKGKIGTTESVKIMTIDYIKGLEFECVFMVDIDRIANRYRDFAARALYLGATRAASVLGIAYGVEFPAELAHVRHFFDRG